MRLRLDRTFEPCEIVIAIFGLLRITGLFFGFRLIILYLYKTDYVNYCATVSLMFKAEDDFYVFGN